MSCPVQFCRKNCEILPNDAEVNRADRRATCDICKNSLENHIEVAYPSGMKHVVRDCEGKYWHL